ncbi:TPA: hypothetical protein ACPSKE_003284 [Legionella feeleii]
MNSLFKIILGGFLAVASTCLVAGSTTDMSKDWTCTTNASSATTDADKAADDKLANTKDSATSSFSSAAQNCRDCTKITCEVSN